MYLYVAFFASLLAGVDAGVHSQIEKAGRHPELDVAGIIKYAREHPDSAPAYSRNLRDLIKPDDFVNEFFRDASCSVPMRKTVEHGNTCHINHNGDGSTNMAKINK